MKTLLSVLVLSASCYAQVVNPGGGSGSGGSGTVTSIATTGPITGGTITTTGTIACATCTTAAAALTNLGALAGAGGHALQSSSQLLVSNLGTAGTEAWTLTNTALATTPTGGYALTNSTVAAAAAQQVSPPFTWTGQGWKTTSTAASQAVAFRSYVLPVQGTTNPTGTWNLDFAVNGGAFGNDFSLDSSGRIKLGGGQGGVSFIPGAGTTQLWGATGFAVLSAADGGGGPTWVAIGNTAVLGFPSISTANAPPDTNFSRASAGVMQVGTGSTANALGKLNFAGGTIVDGTVTTGATRLVLNLGAADTNTTNIFSISGTEKFGGNNTTAAVAGVIGTTCPAITCTAAYTWVQAVSSDGSTVYFPVWK